MANWEDKKWFDGKKEIPIKRGSFFTSLDHIKEKSGKGISIMAIRGCLLNLETLHFLTNETTNKGRYINIINYDYYQNSKLYQQAKQQSINKRITNKQQQVKNTMQLKNERSKDKELFVGNQNHFRLTNLLKDLILQNDPKAKVPEDITKWVDSIEKLERIDKRTAEEIEAVIRFSQEDDFWKANILSTKKLRKQFSQLMLKAKQNFGGLSGKNRRSLTAIMNADYGEGEDE